MFFGFSWGGIRSVRVYKTRKPLRVRRILQQRVAEANPQEVPLGEAMSSADPVMAIPIPMLAAYAAVDLSLRVTAGHGPCRCRTDRLPSMRSLVTSPTAGGQKRNHVP